MNRSDLELLQQYAREGSEQAFATVVDRHIHLVYSTALRLVRQRHLAEDVSQIVFIGLARKAPSMRGRGAVAAWLYCATRRAAVDVIRKESRRQKREQSAVEAHDMQPSPSQSEPAEGLLDEAIEGLEPTDRSAILLRFFEGKSLREVGEMLGSSEDAVQKRLSRALEKLRKYFVHRGVSVSPGVVLTAIATQSAQAATPAALSATVATASIAAASAAGATGLTSTLVNTVFMSKTQTALAAALVVSTASLVWQYLANSRLERQLAAAQAAKALPETPTIAANPAQVPGSPVVITNVMVQPFDWRAVESPDYRQYIANLRAIGCPEQTIRDLVSADLRKNLLDKLQIPARKPVWPFWLDDERAIQAAMNESFAEGEQLVNQFAASHLQLLGVAPDHATLQTFMNSVVRQGTFDSKQVLTENWSAELKESVAALERAHSRKIRETGTVMTTGWETSMERMAQEREREQALAELLSPTELTEYLLRDSVTARMMRQGLRDFRPTEDEFRKIFPFQREFDHQWGSYGSKPSDPSRLSQYNAAREQLLGQIHHVLGDERFSSYRLAIEPGAETPGSKQQASVPASQ